MRLSAIAESFVSTNQPLDAIFAEQVRRLRYISDSDWADACRRELRRNTRLFDTRPVLRDRLAAMGVGRRQALKLKLERTDEPVSRLLPEWEAIESTMTQWILARHHAAYQTTMDHASVVLGRPARTR